MSFECRGFFENEVHGTYLRCLKTGCFAQICGQSRPPQSRGIICLLEPAARVAVDGEVDDLEALDAGLGDGEVLLECDVCHVGKAPIEEVV